MKRGAQRAVSIEVTNTGDTDIYLVGVVDGSEACARYPKWQPIVEGESAPPPPERPDFTSPLLPDDFRLLKPGERFDPTDPSAGGRFFPISAFDALSELPGRYRVSLELDTRSEDVRQWMGTLPVRGPELERQAAAVSSRLRAVPRLVVRSNALEITVG